MLVRIGPFLTVAAAVSGRPSGQIEPGVSGRQCEHWDLSLRSAPRPRDWNAP